MTSARALSTLAGRQGATDLLPGWPVVLEGLISIVLGVLAFVWPPFSRGAIRVLVAWGLLTGMCEVIAAAPLPRQLAVHWLLATAGAFSIFLALAVLFLPHAGSDRVALVGGGYAISLRFRLAQLGPEWSHERAPTPLSPVHQCTPVCDGAHGCAQINP